MRKQVTFTSTTIIITLGAPLSGLFTGTTPWHGILGLLGCVPGPVGAVANFVDGAIYLAEGDYFGAIICFLNGATMGVTSVATTMLKAGKLCSAANSALRVAMVTERIAGGLTFAQNAYNIGQTGIQMYCKYGILEESLGLDTVGEALSIGFSALGCRSGLHSMGNTSGELLALQGRMQNKSGSKSSLGALGNTGEVRYREGRTVNPMEVTYEMRLNPEKYAYAVADKYGINLRGSGQQINIKFDPYHTKGPGVSRELDPTNIILGPQAFMNEEELARTISHELNHARSWLKGGRAPEDTARAAENALGDYINGGR